MHINIEAYNSDWPLTFEKIKTELLEWIGFLHPNIAHIGSTSIEGLSAKPIIDILVGLAHESDLEKVIKPLTGKDYVYYEKYNAPMPYRRFFVKHKVSPQSLSIPVMITDQRRLPESTHEHGLRLAHVHVLAHSSEHWLRHIAFRDYIRAHPDVKQQYQRLKKQLSLREWIDGNEYNEAKNSFMKAEEQKALRWYAGG